MPIHDWTRVDAGLFHDFHQSWTVALRNALNAGVLPRDYFALVEQRLQGPIPDVLTLRLANQREDPQAGLTGLAVATAPPRAHVVRRSEAGAYAAKANRVTVRHRHGDVVAVVEIVSPGNKASRAELRSFIEKSTEFIRVGVHLLVIDLIPPGPRDPHGIHKALWDEIEEEDFELPPEKPLTVASYSAGAEKVAYVEPVAVGDALPHMPLFLRPDVYVPAPLEESYRTAWADFPEPLKPLLEGPAVS